VVNPNATTTSPRVTDVLVHALAGAMELESVVTQRRRHAVDLGERARRERFDVVITLGGDGTINETVNGMLADGPGPDVPLLATVPGGSANVFARALGLPADPVEATGAVLEALAEGKARSIGLGTVRIDEREPQWFLANAGLGIDAEIVAAMEEARDDGKEATPGRYLALTVRQLLRGTDRRSPALVVQRPDQPDLTEVFLAIVQNTRPWTYFGSKPIDPCPAASFETGLDVMALRDLGLLATVSAASRMLRGRGRAHTRAIDVLHDESAVTVTANRPTAIQVDGESLGTAQCAVFTSHPAALRVTV
jgi:diacylglycerol kinase family enzyme